MKTCYWIVGCSFFIAVLITGIVLFAVSFSVLPLNSWGLVYDNNSKELKSKTYSSGRYFLGVGKKFIQFPRGYVTVMFDESYSESATNSLSAWTSDGLSVSIDASFFYQINSTQLYYLYTTFGNNWQANAVRIAYSSIKDTTNQFDTISYFNNRQAIKTQIIQTITTRFLKYTNNSLQLIDFQLRQIRFTSTLEAAILNKLLQLQQLKTYASNATSLLINEKTKQYVQQTNNKIQLINNVASNAGQVLLIDQESSQFSSIIVQLATSYQQIFTTLSITNDAEKIDFIYANELGQLSNNNQYAVNFGQMYVSN